MATSLPGIITFIGIGSNLEEPLSRCREAIDYIKVLGGCVFERHASFYRTEPVGFLNQAWFINTVLELRTTLSARQIMQEIQDIEKSMGRQKHLKWGPRIIDLDVLFYGQDIINDDDFTVPHPELHKRRFVMEPLYEIAPYVIHPAFGISVAGLMQRLADNSQVQRIADQRGEPCCG